MLRPTRFILSMVCAGLLATGSGCSSATQPSDGTSSPPATTSDAAPPGKNVDAEGFALLTLSDFALFQGEPTTWAESDGVLTTTGKPKGYLYSKLPHRNFTWRGEFRFVPVEGAEPDKVHLSNTGFMLCIQEPHKVWPRSLEVQGRHDEMGSVKANGGVAALTIQDDPAVRESARKPVGEWNAVEIRCVDGAVTALLNGQVICSSQPGEVTEGLIGLQAENFPVEFRGLKIREE